MNKLKGVQNNKSKITIKLVNSLWEYIQMLRKGKRKKNQEES